MGHDTGGVAADYQANRPGFARAYFLDSLTFAASFLTLLFVKTRKRADSEADAEEGTEEEAILVAELVAAMEELADAQPVLERLQAAEAAEAGGNCSYNYNSSRATPCIIPSGEDPPQALLAPASARASGTCFRNKRPPCLCPPFPSQPLRSSEPLRGVLSGAACASRAY